MRKLNSKNQTKLNKELIESLVDKDILQLIELLKSGANPNTLNDEGLPIVYVALKNNDLCIVEYLLRYGADLDLVKCKEVLELENLQEIADLLICAVENGCPILAVFILDHIGNVDFKSPYAIDLISFAFENFCSEIVDYAVERGYDINSLSIDGHAAIHNVAQGNNFILFETLIDEYKTDINIQNIDGKTALHIVTENEDMDSITLLVEKGADMFILDNNRETPIDIARRTDNAEIVEYLNLNSRSSKIKRILGKIQ